MVKLVDALETRLGGVSQDQRETQKARSERNEARQRWHATARLAANLARSILEYAGQDALAEKVVPSRRQVDRVDPPRTTATAEASAPSAPAADSTTDGSSGSSTPTPA